MKSAILFFFAFSATAQAQWKNESEAGVVLNHGNSHSQTLNAQQDSRYQWDKNGVFARGHFLRTSSGGALSAKRWDALLKYERELSERFSVFFSQGVESDRFAGYLQRYNTDIGPKYYLYKDAPALEWFLEAGYRYTRERRTDGVRQSFQKARLYTEASHQWAEGASSKLWIEYVPNFSRSRDWLLNTEISTTATLTDILAMKVAYLLKYDNEPNPGANKKRDGVFTTSLVAKY